MPSRELIYRVSISTSDAKRQARNVRATFEAELRTIQVGKLDVSQIQAAVSQAQRLRVEFEQAAVAANRVSQNASNIRPPAVAPTAPPSAASGGIGAGIRGAIGGGAGIRGAIVGGVAGYLSIQGLQLISNYVVESAKLDTQIRRTEAAFEFLAGGAAQAEARILALQQASNGTITRLNAMTSSNQIAALSLASTTQEFEELAKAAKIVSTYSSQINDFNDALAQLGLFSNSSSYQRADQLLIDSGALVERMRELKAEDSSLTDQQVKLKASVQLLNSEFGPLLDSTVAQASGAEQLAVAWGEFINQKSDISATFNVILGGIADVVDEMSVLTGFGNSRAILEVTKANAEAAASSAQWFLAPAWAERNAKAFDFTAKLLEKLNKGVKDGIPTALEYRQQVEAIAVAANRFGLVTQSQTEALLDIDSAYRSATASAKVFTNTEELARLSREKKVLDQQVPIESAIAGRAAIAAPVAGVDETIKLYREQKAAVDTAIKQLIDSGVSDQNELAIRVAAITTELLAPFDELEAKASAIDLGATIGNFDQVGTALAGLNAGFVDFLPGLSAAREELVTLSTEMALTGQITDEQAARLEYLAAVAYSAADGGSALSQVVGDLGTDFLESNSYAAELVNQLFLAEAAYASGAITGDIYAGITTILTGRLLTLAQGAGIATGAIYALNQAQAGLASAGGLAVGGNIANRIQTAQAASGREQNRREMERYNRDLARSQERSAGRAGKLLEDGAKKASQELKSALDKVPGLFSASQVTEQDMKDTELGVYQEKADEYLRRLRDEVQNGRDWEDVSIEEARAGLERAGLQIGETAEQTLMFLERAINDSSLYSAVENIPIFINEEAVKLTQELQNKSEEGRKNIYEYFGIQVDEAVGAATGGGGGGAAIEVSPPELIDIDPYTEGLQTGLDEYVNTNGELIKEQMANAPNLIFDPAMLFDPESLVVAAQKKTEAAAAQYKAALDTAGLPMGPMAKPTVTVTADASAQAWGPVVAGTQPAQIALAPTIDTAELQATLDAITAPTLTATIVLPDDAANQLVLNLGNQLGQQAAIMIEHGEVIGMALISGMSAALSVDGEGNAQIDFAGFVANNLGAQAQTFIAQGRGIASLLQQGITEGMAPAESETATGGFAVQIASITVADGVRAPDVSVMAKIDKFAIDQTALLDADLSIAPTIDLTTASEERQKLERALTFSIKPALFISDEVKQTFATDLETTMPPVAIHPNIFAGTTQISDFYVDLQDNLVSPPVQPILAITAEEIQRFNTLIGAAVHPVVEVGLSIPQQQTNTDGSQGANAITPLITDINTQIRSSQEEIKNQGITIAMILMAGISAHFRGGQSSGGEQAATPLADALMTNVSAQFSAVQNMFYAIGFGPAKSVESGFKGYGYSGLSSGLMDALTNGIRADAENYMQRGATIAGYVQSGMNQQFSAEAGVRSAIAAGAAWGNAFMQGVFEALNGAGFVDQISTQVIDGITGELEQP